MALIGIACGCGHTGWLSSATLPRLITCTLCGYRRRVDHTEGHAVRGWRKTKAPVSAAADTGQAAEQSAARTGIHTANAALTPGQVNDAWRWYYGDGRQKRRQRNAAIPVERRGEHQDRHAAILAEHFARSR